jgi:hypothetical protein
MRSGGLHTDHMKQKSIMCDVTWPLTLRISGLATSDSFFPSLFTRSYSRRVSRTQNCPARRFDAPHSISRYQIACCYVSTRSNGCKINDESSTTLFLCMLAHVPLTFLFHTTVARWTSHEEPHYRSYSSKYCLDVEIRVSHGTEHQKISKLAKCVSATW